MRWIQFRILAILFAFVLTALPAAAQSLASLNGTWEGSLRVTGSQGDVDVQPYKVRIVIAGAAARVFVESGSQFQEVKPGVFRVGGLGPSAIIVALDSGGDNEGTWYETWDFAVTLKDSNTLMTNLSRIVNNADLPLSSTHSKFSVAAMGELLRTK